MLTRAVLNNYVLLKLGKSVNRHFLANVGKRYQTTTTVGLTGDQIHDTQVECPVTFVDSPCTPSSPSKIYPTQLDDYDSIPVVVNGKVITCNPELMLYRYPLIPSLEIEAVEDSDEPGETEEHISISKLMNVEFAQNMPTILDEDKPERDKVNFPREKELVKAPGYRMLVFPENWFKALYPKTGVTGPYCFALTFSGFLMSKELWILEHSFVAGVYFLGLSALGVWKFGGKLKENSLAIHLKQRQGWHDWKEGSVKFLENYIKMKEESNYQMQNSGIIFDAKRENILLQQEAEYRNRSMKVYQEALKKVNFQVALEQAKKAFAQKHMVNWIIDNVYKSITPQQQKVILDQCLVDLKSLASKKQGTL